MIVERYNKKLDIIERLCPGCKLWQHARRFPLFVTYQGGNKPPVASHCIKCRNATRSKAIARAMPKWVNKQEIRNIYANCPKDHDVDHIIPLHGKTVSGLHVPWNLQYLPISENRKKSNKIAA